MSTNENKYYRVVKWAQQQGGTGNVMEALAWDAERFEEGFTLANDLQNRDWVKLLYSNYNKNLIVVELTLVGLSKAKES